MKNNLKKFYKDKTILVTGGVGSIGSEIVKKLLKKYNPKIIRIFDNNETGLFNLNEKLQSKKIRLFIGDIRDKERLQKAIDGTDIVFHAVALKHVSLCEYNPFEAIQTNVVGSQNVIDACLSAGVKKMINISTDKAVNPVNAMGATKLLTEKLITAVEHYKGKKKTIFASVRFGNVLNSRGSIVPLIKHQIKKGGPITITNPNMTRFVMSIDKAVNLVLKTAEMAEGGEIFILKMPALRIGDFANVMIEKFALQYKYNPKKIKIKIIGEKPGEKFHEELITEKEIKNTYETKDMFIILPEIQKKDFAKKTFLKKNVYAKKSILLDKIKIKKLLKKY